MSSGSGKSPKDKREAFKERTRFFAIACIRLADTMPNTASGRNASSQLIRSATSVAANYRAACRARSEVECLAKLGIVEEEGDEAEFWLGLARDVGLCGVESSQLLQREANEIVAIVVTSIRNMRERVRASKKPLVVRESPAEDLFSDFRFPISDRPLPTSDLPPPTSEGLE